MLSLLRLLTVVIGAATVYYVLNGTMKDEMFRIPHLIAGGAMVLAALTPRGIAASAMTTAGALALGVFLVALMTYVGPGKPVDLKLIAAMAVNLTTILLLHPRGGHH
ncbi:MAG: hypothetical protein EOP62_01620 [Sphingomonadales bacterium]|nr:MAG: hypothetical protein EOP62_01620 [Sphingomonadales bacterium]